jgi:hypothetical protein
VSEHTELQPYGWNATTGTTVTALADGTAVWRHVLRVPELVAGSECLATARNVDFAMSEHAATDAHVGAEGDAIIGVDFECAVSQRHPPGHPLLECFEGSRLVWWCGFIKCAQLAFFIKDDLTCSAPVVRAGKTCRARVYVAHCTTEEE